MMSAAMSDYRQLEDQKDQGRVDQAAEDNVEIFIKDFKADMDGKRFSSKRRETIFDTVIECMKDGGQAVSWEEMKV
jgi:hypothetical protein